MLISVHTMKPKPVAPVPVTFRALAVAWAKVARHYFTGERTTQAWVLAGITVLGSFVTSWLLVWFSSIQKEVSNSLIDKDDARFRAALWQFLLLVLGSSPLFALNRYLEDRFSLEWRRYMTEKALAKYFSGKAFFRLSLAGSAESAHAAHMDAGRRVDGERAVPNEQSGMVQPGLDNPDQRICNDIKSFTETSVTVCLVVIRNVSNSVAFISVLWSASPFLVYCLMGFALLGTWFTTVVYGRPLMALFWTVVKREGDFRYSLVRVRENAESVAFYSGEASEGKNAWERLASLLAVSSHYLVWQLGLNLWREYMYYMYSTYIIPPMVLAPRYFAGVITFGAISQASYAFSVLERALGTIVQQFSSLSGLAAETQRLMALLAALDDPSSLSRTPSGELPPKVDHRLISVPAEELSASASPSLDDALLEVDLRLLRTPGGQSLIARDLQFLLRQRHSLLIMGMSGCGKSSLLRAMAGLWEEGLGEVRACPKPFFLPQKPYMALGTLRDQLVFPSQVGPQSRVKWGGVPSGPPPAPWRRALGRVLGFDVRTGAPLTDERVVIHAEAPELDATDADLEAMLDRCHLGYLASREGGLSSERDWASVLSLGEQQRVAFARLLLHRPRLALLDEATSALDMATEASLYRQLRSAVGAYVSVGHRTQLLEHHTHVLEYQGDGQWRLSASSAFR